MVIGLTDQEGDFHSYTVDVLSLTLTKLNGAVVETLPLNTRIDFAQYTEMTEFLTAATIPSGVYVKAQMQRTERELTRKINGILSSKERRRLKAALRRGR